MTEYIQNKFVETIIKAPRFGHTTDFSLLFQQENTADYTLGTIFIGSLLFAVFLTWLILLAIFMCLGPRKVGFLAGFSMKHPYEKEKYRTPMVVRIFFCLSCAVVISASVLGCILFGFKDLKVATDEAFDIVDGFTKNAIEGEEMLRYTIGQVSDFRGLRDTIVDELRKDSFCPNPELDDLSGQPVNSMRNSLVQDLYDLEDFGQANLTQLRSSAFAKMKINGEDTEFYFDVFGIKQWELWFYMISFSSISIFMLFGTILTWSGCTGRFSQGLACFNTWVLLPIFLVLVTAAWTIVSFYGIGAVMNGDFCAGGDAPGSPDVSAKKIVDATPENAYVGELYKYWLNGDCDAEFPISFVTSIRVNLDSAKDSIGNLTQVMNDATNLEAICGRDFDSIKGYLMLLTEDYTVLNTNITAVEKMLGCEVLHSSYVALVHDVSCEDIPEAGAWAFGSLLIVAFFSMLMITFRSAWLPVVPKDTGGTPEISTLDLGHPQDVAAASKVDSFNDSPPISPPRIEDDNSPRSYGSGGKSEDENNATLEARALDDSWSRSGDEYELKDSDVLESATNKKHNVEQNQFDNSDQNDDGEDDIDSLLDDLDKEYDEDEMPQDTDQLRLDDYDDLLGDIVDEKGNVKD